ncbi:SSS family solute:Na+ symporter [Kineosphaera limosa]|uniref:Putative sodium/solute symporter n=1 Tax=Kineosphaera limosa NBRC 100340 TaxID=1184609 RepID=K6WQM9_9MICO|nr:sodium:solute symporter family protein [Kineosphaera limosa]NYE01920.1 SSS family solute:Na+ symporter [Kineosphaera limosa]GAB96146.1 putative sodium/solute symporter [Kineosphaera limosa NBRC 100340]
MDINPHPIYLIVFIGFVIVMIGVGLVVARRNKTGEDFLMAGRGLSTPLLLATTLATLVGTGSSLGAVGFAYENGWAGALYGIGGALGVILLMVMFANVRKYGFMTYSEEVSFYYGADRRIKGLVAIVLLLASVGWLGAHVLGGALYLTYLTGIDPSWSKVIVALGFGIYTVIGGYLAVVITDVIQGTLLFFGFMTLAVLALTKVGGSGGLSATNGEVAMEFLGIQSLGAVPAASLAIVIAVGVLATPSYRQRIYSAANTGVVRRSLLWVAGLFALFSVMPAIVGMAAHSLNPDLASPDMAFPYLATEVFPLAVGAFLLVAGLSATMSSGDSDAVTAVTILLRDVYQLVTGRMPQKDKMLYYSRAGLLGVLTFALIGALVADTIIGYITTMISTILTGLLVASIMGRFWERATWQGGMAAIITGSVAALMVQANSDWSAFWGNPVIPSLLTATVFGVVVSLVTPPNQVSDEEALKVLAEERAQIDVGTVISATES